VRDVLIILSIAFGALYLSWHHEKFDTFMYRLIGYRYRHWSSRRRQTLER
jgi:hypothetical protein